MSQASDFKYNISNLDLSSVSFKVLYLFRLSKDWGSSIPIYFPKIAGTRMERF